MMQQLPQSMSKVLVLAGFRVLAGALVLGLMPGCPPPSETPAGPLALFSATPTSGDLPLEVTFTDESNPGSGLVTLRRWDFGDGTVSTDENPTHTYTKAGKFSVTLTIATVVGVDHRTRNDYIVVKDKTAPRANFTVDKREGIAPLAVTFGDRSAAGSSEITSWAWDFGDGESSTEQNPKHTYSKIGVFAVSLTVESAVGEDTETKGAYVVVRGEDLAFGGPAADRAFGLAETEDGRYVLAGDTESPEDGSRDVYLVFTDTFGNLGSERRFGGEDDESASGLVPAGDGGYFIAGTVELGGGGSDALLIRTDASGNRLWSNTYGGPGDERAAAIAPAIDGGAVLAGLTAEDELAGTMAWATRVDADGRVRWTRTYGGGNFTGVVARGSGFVLCGNTADGLDGRAVKLDAQGEIVWDTVLGGDGLQEARALAAFDGGGYVVAGASTPDSGASDAWAVVVDEDGTPGWSRTVGGTFADRANAVATTALGGVALAGSTRDAAASLDDAYLVSLTPLGEVDWEESFGGAMADRAHALIADEDGGFSLAGSTESFGAAGTNMYLVKTDTDGAQLGFPLE